MDIERIIDGLARLWPAAPLALVGGGLLVGAAVLQWQFAHRQELVQVRATVRQVRTEISRVSAAGGRSWWVYADCDYSWAGQPYSASQIALTGGSVPSQRQMEELLAAHPPGTALDLWIHPRTPGLPMVVAPAQGQVVGLAAFGVVFLAAGAAFFFLGKA